MCLHLSISLSPYFSSDKRGGVFPPRHHQRDVGEIVRRLENRGFFVDRSQSQIPRNHSAADQGIRRTADGILQQILHGRAGGRGARSG